MDQGVHRNLSGEGWGPIFLLSRGITTRWKPPGNQRFPPPPPLNTSMLQMKQIFIDRQINIQR